MKLSLRAVLPLTALAFSIGAGTVYYTVDGSPDAQRPNLDVSAQGPAAKAQVAKSYVGDPDDPATWRLPIEAYMATPVQARVVSSARDELFDQCMQEAGYPDWKPAPDLPQIGGKTLTDWRYGIHDAELASTRGYHPAQGEQEAYDAAMTEGAVDESGAPNSAVSACATKVDSDVPTVQPEGIVQQVSGEAFSESRKNSEVVAAFAKWSACMTGKGYSYKAPMDANDDPRFADSTEVSRLEIDTATADINCREEADVTRTWFDVESEIQRTKISTHLKAFNLAAETAKQAVAKAQAV
ncbi:hypothetical protein [[Kitasatospora] papulosa]|uniref:hypothetical protein n=1 Tax=[Kitasatospora] papulosa TaxID=1464011 RepID=UPI003674B639